MKKCQLQAVLAAVLVLAALVSALGAYTAPKSYQIDELRLQQLASVVYCADALTTYVAVAEPGSSRTAAVWQIKKIVASGSSYPYTVTTTWAGGSNTFSNAVGTQCESMLAANYQ